jgi:integrase
MKYPSLRLVFNRKKTATKEKSSSVQIEVSFQRKKKYITTGVKLTLDQWSEKKQIVVSHAEANDLNNSIANSLSSIRKYIIALQEGNEEFTFEKLSLFLNSFGNKDSFLDFMYDRICIRNLRKSTKQQHLVVHRKLESYGKINTFADLTVQNIRSFDDYIRTTVTVQTTIYSIHKRVKVYVHEAMERELISKDPYDCFKIEKGVPKDRKYLSPSDLEKIESTTLKELLLDQARDLFVFCCYTGLAYSDLNSFKFENLIEQDGNYYIEDNRYKTGSGYFVMILPKALEILDKYDKVLPSVTLQLYNIRLKLIKVLCGINKNLTSHMARHTFATTITLANDVPIEIVSRMLGHKRIETTQVYAKIMNTSVVKHMESLKNKLENKK